MSLGKLYPQALGKVVVVMSQPEQLQVMKDQLDDMGIDLEGVYVVDTLQEAFDEGTEPEGLTDSKLITVLHDHCRFHTRFSQVSRNLLSNFGNTFLGTDIMAHGALFSSRYLPLKNIKKRVYPVNNRSDVLSVPAFTYRFSDAEKLREARGSLVDRARSLRMRVRMYNFQRVTSNLYRDHKVHYNSFIRPVWYPYDKDIPKSESLETFGGLIMETPVSVVVRSLRSAEMVGAVVSMLEDFPFSTITVVLDGVKDFDHSSFESQYGDKVSFITSSRTMGEVYGRYISSQSIEDGTLVVYVDDGEILLPDILQKVLDERRKHQVDVVYGSKGGVNRCYVTPVEVWKNFDVTELYDRDSDVWLESLSWQREVEAITEQGYQMHETSLSPLS